ncbi:MAG: peptidylprolyl isomerase [Planctomycetota bacterium]
MLPVVAFALVPLTLSVGESLVVRPMYLGEKPPQVRSARHILLRSAEHGGVSDNRARSRDEVMALARSLVERSRAGSDFAKLASEHSEDPDAATGAVLGTFAPGMLSPHLDAFLFSADLGSVSEPIGDDKGFHILQRIESHAAVRQILLSGPEVEVRARWAEIAGKLREGADFSELARTRSDDRETAARGGQFAIYERGPADALLKSAAFGLRMGEISEPIQSPFGWHVLQRIPLDEMDPSLAEPSFVRLRGILLRVDGTSPQGRDRVRTLDLADRLHQRLRAGEDMRELAREFDEDVGGKEREGDLGWVFRNQPGLPRELKRACLLRIGDVAEPQRTAAGYLVVRRER